MSDLDINKEAGNKEEGKNNRKFLLIGFIILLLAINGIQYFMGSKKDEKIEKQVIELKESDTKIKALSHELDSLENEIKSKIDEIEELVVLLGASSIETKIYEISDELNAMSVGFNVNFIEKAGIELENQNKNTSTISRTKNQKFPDKNVIPNQKKILENNNMYYILN